MRRSTRNILSEKDRLKKPDRISNAVNVLREAVSYMCLSYEDIMRTINAKLFDTTMLCFWNKNMCMTSGGIILGVHLLLI